MNIHPETICVDAGREHEIGGPVGPAVDLATTFIQGGEYEYIREGSPAIEPFERAIGALEGGHAVAFSSGMGAVAGILEGLDAGARVVAPTVAYAGARKLLAERAERGLLDVVFVDQTDTAATMAALAGAALLWTETPNNPLIQITDLAALGAAAREHGAATVVDATLATPLRQRSLELGADYVLHSATKYISGHSDALLGVVAVADESERDRLVGRRTLTGAVPGPLETYLGLRGVRTLALRFDRAEENAAELARRLAAHPGVVRVRYPGLPDDPGHELAERQMSGFGAMVSFELAAGVEAADALCRTTRIAHNATSLGGVETLIERRGRYPDESPQVPAGLIRLSVGCEHVDDLWADLERALAERSLS